MRGRSDDDPDNNGVGNTPATNGAVVQYVRAAATDTAGNIEGFPSAAFDWNTFAYYSTYVAYHDASGTADRIYVRDQAGTAKYQWDTPSGEHIIGTPRWNTTGTTHYLYVALASGKVYRLVDNGTSLVPDSSGNWAGANNPFNCACTIVSPLTMDTSNLFWGGTTAGPVQKIWTLGQASRAQPMGSPFVITPALTTASPGFWPSGSTTYLFFGLVGNIIKFNATNPDAGLDQHQPGFGGDSRACGADRARPRVRRRRRRDHVGAQRGPLRGHAKDLELRHRGRLDPERAVLRLCRPRSCISAPTAARSSRSIPPGRP